MKSLIFLGGLVASATASAQAPAPSNPTSATPDPGQTICRNQDNTGSRLSRTRVCRTRAEWADAQRATRQALEQHQSNRRTAGGN